MCPAACSAPTTSSSSDRYCLAKIYTGGDFNPRDKAPLAQPGLNLAWAIAFSPSTAQD